MKNIEKLVIMEYQTGRITVLNNPPEDKSTEDILKKIDLDIDDCAVMFCNNIRINYINYNELDKTKL